MNDTLFMSFVQVSLAVVRPKKIVLLVAVWQKSRDGGYFKEFLFHAISCNITQQLIKNRHTLNSNHEN